MTGIGGRSADRLGRVAAGACAAVLVVLAIWGSVVTSARGASIAPYPGVSFPSGAFNSRCAAISLGPMVVQVGQKLSASAGPPTDQCDGAPSTVAWSWALGGTVVSGCGANATHCVVKETTPTDLDEFGRVTKTYKWKQGCINGTSGFGGWASCGMYVVLDHQFLVSGRVTSPGSSSGVAGVSVKADCASGGTAVTDKTGIYRFALSRGPCRISPQPASSESSNPAARTVQVNGDVGGVNFELGCAGAQPGAARANVTAHSTSPCALKVFVKTTPGSIRSGLAIHRDPYVRYPVDMTIPGGTPQAITETCESGCANVEITVIDTTTHKPAAGASVDVKLGAIADVTGKPYICEANTGCSDADLTDIRTDSSGQAHLIYWAPGVVKRAVTHLRITATEECSASACPAKRKVGEKFVTLTEKPDLVYEHTSELSEDEIREMAAWAGGTAIFTRLMKLTTGGETALDLTLKFMRKYEIAAEQASEALEVIEHAPVEKVFAPLEVFKVFTELWERRAMIDLFFKLNQLSPTGLGANPSESSASAAPSLAFENHLVNYGVVIPFNYGADGLWWGIAQTLRYLQKHHDPGFRPTQIKLKIYEVSHCDVQAGRCGPGYRNVEGSDGVVNPGLQPELYMQFFVDDSHEIAKDYYHFIVPYDAIAWTQTQPLLGKLNGVLP